MKPIGFIKSDLSEKFGIPKQSGLAPSLEAAIVFEGECGHETFWRGIEDCSHLWIIFHFHKNKAFSGGTVRPPILGGETRMGIFATRSPHRPNPIGQSLVKFESISFCDGKAFLKVSGHDFLDGTPVFDVKPYVASYDTPQTHPFHWSDSQDQRHMDVKWEIELENFELKTKIEQVLSLDPRPRSSKAKKFGLSIENFNVEFEAEETNIIVKSVQLGQKKIK